MNDLVKKLLGIASAWPLIAGTLIMAFFISAFSTPEPVTMSDGLETVVALGLLVTVLLNIGLFIFYFIKILGNTALSTFGRWAWLFFFLVWGWMTMPLYWLVYIRHEEPNTSLRQTHTAKHRVHLHKHQRQ